jgi:hypothetical protein
VPIVIRSGSLHLLEPSGPVKACNGIALVFTFICDQVFDVSLLKFCTKMVKSYTKKAKPGEAVNVPGG